MSGEQPTEADAKTYYDENKNSTYESGVDDVFEDENANTEYDDGTDDTKSDSSVKAMFFVKGFGNQPIF